MKAEAAASTAVQPEDAMMPSPFAATFEDPLAAGGAGLDDELRVPVLGLA